MLNSPKKIILIIILLAAAAGVGLFAFRGIRTLSIISSAGGIDVGAYENFSVEPEANRLDILLLGMRGMREEQGDVLADAIMLASYDRDTKEAALVSIPRDLYVELPEYPKKEKINFAYPLGERRSPNGGGLALSKKMMSFISGVYVDYAVSVNFQAFERAVDLLGGVNIRRETPFIEDKQFQGEGWENSGFWHCQNPEKPKTQMPNYKENCKWVFEVPAGRHTLSGREALYYIRSRYTTSDFDRMRRQQEVLGALRRKAASLGVLANPLKMFEFLDIVGDNVRTDMDTAALREAGALAREISSGDISYYSLDTTNLLQEEFTDNGTYVLLPKDKSYEELRRFFSSLFSQK